MPTKDASSMSGSEPAPVETPKEYQDPILSDESFVDYFNRLDDKHKRLAEEERSRKYNTDRMRMRGDVLEAIARRDPDAMAKKEDYDRIFRRDDRQLDARSRDDGHGID